MIIKGHDYQVVRSNGSIRVTKNGTTISHCYKSKTGFKVSNHTNNMIPHDVMRLYLHEMHLQAGIPSADDSAELPYEFSLLHNIECRDHLNAVLREADDIRRLALSHGITV